MSSNSWPRIFATAPIVSALRGREAEPSGERRSASACRLRPSPVVVAIAISALQVAELVLADLDLVAIVELVGLDSPPVDVGAVQRAQVVDVEAVATADEERVVSRDRDVVEEHRRV